MVGVKTYVGYLDRAINVCYTKLSTRHRTDKQHAVALSQRYTTQTLVDVQPGVTQILYNPTTNLLQPVAVLSVSCHCQVNVHGSSQTTLTSYM